MGGEGGQARGRWEIKERREPSDSINAREAFKRRGRSDLRHNRLQALKIIVERDVFMGLLKMNKRTRKLFVWKKNFSENLINFVDLIFFKSFGKWS